MHFLFILAPLLLLIHIPIVHAVEVTDEQKTIIDNYCLELKQKIQSEQIFVDTNIDPTFNVEKIYLDADTAQYKKICGTI